MSNSGHSRIYAAAVDGLGRAALTRVDVELGPDGDVEVQARAYVDPNDRSGRGSSAGVISGLATLADARGGAWLLALVERGRPRLLDPDRLGVVALLGRRREWRGAAGSRSPFVAMICDRPPVRVGADEFMVSRDLRGRVDLLRVRPGAAIERWALGELPGRVELLAGASTLVLVCGDRVAAIDVAALEPGGCPLTDPRDVELAPRWLALPEGVLAVCDVLDDPPTLRVIEADAEHRRVVELELEHAAVRPRTGWAIDPPQRWLAGAGSLWLLGEQAWTRVAAGEGPVERSTTLAGANAATTLELDAAGHPWLWQWDPASAELCRVDGLRLEQGLRRGWALPQLAHLRPRQLHASAPGPVGERVTIVHADELAELLALEPELAERWPGWFDRE